MTALAWLVLADTLVTALALVLAVLAWRRVGDYMRCCRSTVQAYASLVDTRPHRAVVDDQPTDPEGIDPVDDVLDEPIDQQPAGRHAADDYPSGRHALVEVSDPGITAVSPAVGDLADDQDDEPLQVPRYYREHEQSADTMPRYYFAEGRR